MLLQTKRDSLPKSKFSNIENLMIKIDNINTKKIHNNIFEYDLNSQQQNTESIDCKKNS